MWTHEKLWREENMHPEKSQHNHKETRQISYHYWQSKMSGNKILINSELMLMHSEKWKKMQYIWSNNLLEKQNPSHMPKILPSANVNFKEGKQLTISLLQVLELQNWTIQKTTEFSTSVLPVRKYLISGYLKWSFSLNTENLLVFCFWSRTDGGFAFCWLSVQSFKIKKFSAVAANWWFYN